MKGLSSLFARRYLFSRKSHSVINIISVVSAFAVAVPVAAMVILLSVFNGFEGLVKEMFRDFDPDIEIAPAGGKIFPVGDIDTRVLSESGLVDTFSFVMEDNVLLEYRGRQGLATIRGVDDNYADVVPFERMVFEGDLELMRGDMPQAVVGRGLAYEMAIRTAFYDPLLVYVPRRGSFSPLLPLDSYRQGRLYPGGIFALDADTDSKYILTPLLFMQELLDYEGYATGLMVKLTDGQDPGRAKEALAALLGDSFRVRTRVEQKASLYQVMKYEKWGIFTIILMVLIISSFSVIGSLVMLVIEKRGDIRTLVNMGADVGFIRSVFRREGMLITLSGAVGGMAVGLAVCFIQVRYGLVKIPARTFLVDAYPVQVQPMDMVAVAGVFLAVGYIIVSLTVRAMVPKSTLRI